MSDPTEDDIIQLRRIARGGRHTVMVADGVERWRSSGWLEPTPSWDLTEEGRRMRAEAKAREDAFLTANADLIAEGAVMARRAVADIRDAEQKARAAFISDVTALLHEYRFDKDEAYDAVLAYVDALAHPERSGEAKK